MLNMRRKPGVNLEQYFPKADRGALRLLKRMLAFDPAECLLRLNAFCDRQLDDRLLLQAPPLSLWELTKPAMKVLCEDVI